MESFQVYCDGNYSYKNKVGTAACLILKNNIVIGKVKERKDYQNSLVAEFYAVGLALLELPANSIVNVHTDCSTVVYLIRRMLKGEKIWGWLHRNKHLKLFLLISELYELIKKHSIKIKRVSRYHPLISWCDRCEVSSVWDDIRVDEQISLICTYSCVPVLGGN